MFILVAFIMSIVWSSMILMCFSYHQIICDLQYDKFVKPSFEEYILPSKKYADIIIPRGGDNDIAVDLIVQHIRTKLGQHDICKIYPNVFIIRLTFQVKLSGVL